MKAKGGFTLVEILIVVVILGILAAIVIPQFTEASTEAKLSSLVSDLQTVRSQIELYKIQHNDTLPGSTSGVSWEQAMTMKTDVDGTLNANGKYGPYLQKVPTNQFNNLNTVGIDGTVGDGSNGWEFNSTTGAFYADDTLSTNGVAHSTL
jgi:general secretion pathway protein G